MANLIKFKIGDIVCRKSTSPINTIPMVVIGITEDRYFNKRSSATGSYNSYNCKELFFDFDLRTDNIFQNDLCLWEERKQEVIQFFEDYLTKLKKETKNE